MSIILKYSVNGVTKTVSLPVNITRMALTISPAQINISQGQAVTVTGNGAPPFSTYQNIQGQPQPSAKPGKYEWCCSNSFFKIIDYYPAGSPNASKTKQIIGLSPGNFTIRVSYTVNNVTGTVYANLNVIAAQISIKNPAATSVYQGDRLALTGVPPATPSGGAVSWSIDPNCGAPSCGSGYFTSANKDTEFVAFYQGPVKVIFNYTINGVTIKAAMTITVLKQTWSITTTPAPTAIMQGQTVQAKTAADNHTTGSIALEPANCLWRHVPGNGLVPLTFSNLLGNPVSFIGDKSGNAMLEATCKISGLSHIIIQQITISPAQIGIILMSAFNPPNNVPLGQTVTFNADLSPSPWLTQGGPYSWGIYSPSTGDGIFSTPYRSSTQFTSTKEGKVTIALGFNYNYGAMIDITVTPMDLTINGLDSPVFVSDVRNLSVSAIPAGGSCSWDILLVQGNGISISDKKICNPVLTANKAGSVKIRLNYSIKINNKTVSATKEMLLDIKPMQIKLQIDFPTGDPELKDPNTGENPNPFNNQFFFDFSGNLSIPMRARILKSDGTFDQALHDQYFQYLRWSYSPRMQSTFTVSSWQPSAAPDTGAGPNPDLVFTGLPDKNSDFGLKTINLKIDKPDEVIAEPVSTNIELFFYQGSNEHPNISHPTLTLRYNSAEYPNWLYYWTQFLPKGKSDGFGLCTICTNASQAGTCPWCEQPILIEISSLAATTPRHSTGHSGLHGVYETFVHENQHLITWINIYGRIGPSTCNPNLHESTSADIDADCYPDAWEAGLPPYASKPKYPDSTDANFVVGQDDGYFKVPQGSSVGNLYEEAWSDYAAQQLSTSPELYQFDKSDWSYIDASCVGCQGIQW